MKLPFTQQQADELRKWMIDPVGAGFVVNFWDERYGEISVWIPRPQEVKA